MLVSSPRVIIGIAKGTNMYALQHGAHALFCISMHDDALE